jgi:hypothetical protein
MKLPAATYEIRVEGHLDDHWSEWLGGMTLTRTLRGKTILTGALPDQAALYGVLMKMRDLALTLVSIRRIESDNSNSTRAPDER